MIDPTYNVFSEVAGISVKKRTDRRKALAKNLAHCDWPFKRVAYRSWAKTPKDVKVPANWRGSAVEYAVSRSHLDVARRAQGLHAGGGLTLVLEDDAVFPVTFSYHFKQFINVLPDDWDALMLGWYSSGVKPWRGTVKLPLPSNIAVARHCFGLHCYCVREPMLSAWVAALEESMMPADWTFSQLMGRFKVYVPWPGPLVKQANGKSDVTGTMRKLL